MVLFPFFIIPCVCSKLRKNDGEGRDYEHAGGEPPGSGARPGREALTARSGGEPHARPALSRPRRLSSQSALSALLASNSALGVHILAVHIPTSAHALDPCSHYGIGMYSDYHAAWVRQNPPAGGKGVKPALPPVLVRFQRRPAGGCRPRRGRPGQCRPVWRARRTATFPPVAS